VGYLAKQQTVAFGADSDHDTDPGIFNGIYTTAGRGPLDQLPVLAIRP